MSRAPGPNGAPPQSTDPEAAERARWVDEMRDLSAYLTRMAHGAERLSRTTDHGVEQAARHFTLLEAASLLDGAIGRLIDSEEARHVCPRCGSAFAEEVFATFRRVAWERRDGLIHEARDCLCRQGSRAFLRPHPELGDDVVLFTFPGPSGDPHVELGHPLRFVSATPDHYVTEDGGLFTRTSPAREAPEGAIGAAFRREVRGEELLRLTRWAEALEARARG